MLVVGINQLHLSRLSLQVNSLQESKRGGTQWLKYNLKSYKEDFAFIYNNL